MSLNRIAFDLPTLAVSSFSSFPFLFLTASKNDELNLKTYPADQTILQGKSPFNILSVLSTINQNDKRSLKRCQ